MIALGHPGRAPVHESHLAAESEIVGQLLAVLLEERQSLESGPPDTLEAVALQKSRLIARLANRARGGNTGPLAEIHAPTPDWRCATETAATKVVGDAWKALRALYAEAAKLNHDNGLFASRQMAYLRIRNAGLHRAAGTSNLRCDLYRSDGMGSRGTTFATPRMV